MSNKEWKTEIRKFDIRKYIFDSTLGKNYKNYVKTDNHIIRFDSGKLLDPTDEEKLDKLNKDYIDSFKDVFESISSGKTISVSMVISFNPMSIYHLIANENQKIFHIRGKTFFI